MSTNDCREIERYAGAGFAHLPEHDLVLPLAGSQINSLGHVMARALGDEPHVAYLLPNARERQRVLTWFFQSVAIPAGFRYGEIYTTKNSVEAALWISSERIPTLRRMLFSGMRAMPIRLDHPPLRRYLNLITRMEKVRDRLMSGPHWFLFALGVEPSKHRDAIAAALVEPTLARADLDRLPCYVETFIKRDLPFYEALGFRIEGAGQVCKGGPDFWALRRAPRKSAATS
jgi:hypothetical protein